MDSNRKRSAAIGLPEGWVREESERRNGISAGKSDVYYISPQGKKFRSKPELVRHFKHSFDLSMFDYRSGKIIHDKAKLIAQRKRYNQERSGRVSLDTSIPSRQTASIFKRPVSKKTNHKQSRVKTNQVSNTAKANPNHNSTPRAPQQLLREKRLTGLKPSDVTQTIIETIELPKAMQAVGPGTTPEELLLRIASQLHAGTTPLTGQTSVNVMKDPLVWQNTQQPLCKSFAITDDDIRRQESKVTAARRKLEKALNQDKEFVRKELMMLA